jgi:hypothetical protein
MDSRSLEAAPPAVSATTTEWRGFFPGVVVSTEDPEKRGHVRVRVHQVYGDPDTEDEFIPDNSLPWARPNMALHDYHADFEVGDGVWVSFWGGESSEPIWHGQFLGDGDAPDEFTSSYSPRPKTRIIRTSNGHVIELRWVDGEQRITIITEGGREIRLDDVNDKIEIKTPNQLIELLDSGTIRAVTDAGTEIVLDATGVEIKSPTQIIKVLESGDVEIEATGTVKVQGTTSVSLGAAAPPKLKLVMDNFLTLFNAHIHGGIGSPPTVAAVPATHATLITEAN